MADFISLTCPSCGAKLQITKEIDRFACTHCGNELIVKKGGGIIHLERVIARLDKINTGVDKAASELALIRLTNEIDGLLTNKNKYISTFINNGRYFDIFRKYYQLTMTDAEYFWNSESNLRNRLNHLSITDCENIEKIFLSPKREKKYAQFLVAIQDFIDLLRIIEEKQMQLEQHERIVNQ